jgi:crossover junction endodeoxyribonuclease RuvC
MDKFFDVVSKFKIGVAIIEEVHSAPEQGIASTFKFGFSSGLLNGVMIGLGIPIKRVRPAIWKNILGLTQDKKLSIQKANEIYPNTPYFKRMKDHNKAESALLAYLGVRAMDNK